MFSGYGYFLEPCRMTDTVTSFYLVLGAIGSSDLHGLILNPAMKIDPHQILRPTIEIHILYILMQYM